MNVGELRDELDKYDRSMPVRIQMPSLAIGTKCDECDTLMPVDKNTLLRAVGSRKIYHSHLTVFIDTEEA